MKAGWLLASIAALLGACRESGSEHAHDHGHSAGQGEDAAETISITRWADGYELFVELDAPRPGQLVSYHAHVTRLVGYDPVVTGSFEARFERDGASLAVARVDGVARPGIFAPEGKAPDAPGTYRLTMIYRDGERAVAFDGGEIVVGADHAAAPPPASLSFLKEQQWAIDFATVEATLRPLAREVELPAIVEPAGTDRLTVSAATSGRFFHNPDVKLAEGLHIDSGTLVGRIAPTVAGDDFSRLRLAVDEARIAKEQAERERDRVAPLVADGLLPNKRLIEAANAIETQRAKLRVARERIARVTAPGGKGGLGVKVDLGGVVTEILVANGEPVEPGQSLLRIGGERTRWVRARFVARPDEPLFDARAVAVRTPSGDRLDLGGRARLLSSHPTVDPRTQLATFIAEVDADDHGESSHELRSGSHVVLVVQVGERRERLAIPASAVVDINTRRYVFVQLGGESFDKRRVTLGDRDGEFVEVLEGVTSGERVVVAGGYDIHLASIMGQVESHRH